jgi:peptidoglycan glycosyltransferase
MNAPLRRLGAVVAIMFLSLLISTTWVQVFDAESLKDQPTNSRSRYRELGRDRGPILVNGAPIADSVPSKDVYQYQRTYPGGTKYAAVTGAFSVAFGPTGIEASKNDELAGTSDKQFYRRVGDLLTGTEPQGASVELTINAKAQDAAWDALGDQRGAVVALDPATGDILAMVSKPSYNPNQLATHDTAAALAARKRLTASDTDPLLNRAIGGDLYPPGSTFKLITSAAALSSGQYTPDTELDGPASLDLPETTVPLRNDDFRACGPNNKVSLANALKISCNTAFGQLGLDLGVTALNAQAEKFGFGQELSIPLAVTPSTFPADANRPSTAQAAIGQFDVRVTPLQIAMVSAAIANDGKLMRPNLIRRIQTSDFKTLDEPGAEQLSEAVTPDVAQQLTSMMELVVESGTGTRAQIPGIRVAGKTGTAQHGTRANPEPPHAWFTAFAPADDPQVAVAVVVEDGGKAGNEAFGGTVAAPIAKRVIEAVLTK